MSIPFANETARSSFRCGGGAVTMTWWTTARLRADLDALIHLSSVKLNRNSNAARRNRPQL
jgi:hypothetical protein